MWYSIIYTQALAEQRAVASSCLDFTEKSKEKRKINHKKKNCGLHILSMVIAYPACLPQVRRKLCGQGVNCPPPPDSSRSVNPIPTGCREVMLPPIFRPSYGPASGSSDSMKNVWFVWSREISNCLKVDRSEVHCWIVAEMGFFLFFWKENGVIAFWKKSIL